VKIYENSKVEELLDLGLENVVTTTYGQVSANKVGLDTNNYTPPLKSVKSI
jgi:hypothetical protein